MSFRGSSEIKFSTYFGEMPDSSTIRELHDKIVAGILDVFEDMDIQHSHIAVRCPVGFEYATFYGMEDDEAYNLDEEVDEDD